MGGRGGKYDTVSYGGGCEDPSRSVWGRLVSGGRGGGVRPQTERKRRFVQEVFQLCCFLLLVDMFYRLLIVSFFNY